MFILFSIIAFGIQKYIKGRRNKNIQPLLLEEFKNLRIPDDFSTKNN